MSRGGFVVAQIANLRYITPMRLKRNTLFYGDNLDILHEYIENESVDLIYLDPPFNSNRSYNVLFKDESGKEAASAGFYHSPGWDKDYPKLQILSIADLLTGKTVNMPNTSITFKQARKVKEGEAEQPGLL